MDLDDLGLYFETKSKTIDNDLKLDLTMRYYQAVMTSAEKPHKAYQQIYNKMFKKQSKEMTEEQMQAMSKQLTIAMGGTVIKGGG